LNADHQFEKSPTLLLYQVSFTVRKENRFDVTYRDGTRGKLAAAEMNVNVGTPALAASLATRIATITIQSSLGSTSISIQSIIPPRIFRIRLQRIPTCPPSQQSNNFRNIKFPTHKTLILSLQQHPRRIHYRRCPTQNISILFGSKNISLLESDACVMVCGGSRS